MKSPFFIGKIKCVGSDESDESEYRISCVGCDGSEDIISCMGSDVLEDKINCGYVYEKQSPIAFLLTS